MAQVLVRDLPDDVVERLKRKAAADGRSLEAHLRAVLEEASRFDRSDYLAIADEVADSTRGRTTSDSTELIRDSRDRGWR